MRAVLFFRMAPVNWNRELDFLAPELQLAGPGARADLSYNPGISAAMLGPYGRLKPHPSKGDRPRLLA